MAHHEPEQLTETQLKYLRTERTKEMRIQMISFGLMIFLTFIAFALVALELDKNFIVPIVIGLAFIQVALQFYYFMHMKDKGHDFAKLLILTGLYFAIAFVVCFIMIVWIGNPI
ncbi:cytochrome C oxidase subunit IV family protein [Phocicoccus pinnipedialis]|uniref:Cytochrome c oxidase subunit 4B n=1 Tax=Phocicoccus pinnipedialis TaxID=110845 RepID=A0A6V7RIH7_9BACL|nr:cytochrome C oxidase subunit IV family protein [Jeotgalicoccus pinnipedialis]MBP1939019.1 cytochrome c oxidase subunit 4 [Jeotgalicoccus pinnipedialis]CAD2077156.1 Cytochrome c oxidase subunit 4B [Jeotgalicoccus pinnipedialis]